jgi:hypothetical protein
VEFCLSRNVDYLFKRLNWMVSVPFRGIMSRSISSTPPLMYY